MTPGAKWVLIVDDNPDHAFLMQEALALRSDLGMIVECVPSGEECLKTLSQRAFGAVVLDLRLPKMSGLEVLAEMKGHGHDIPVVMVTGLGDENAAVQAMKLGAYDYIVKSRDYLEVLPLTLARVIEHHQMVVANARLQQQIQEAEKRYRQLFQGLNDAVMVYSSQGRFLDCNEVTLKRLGYSREEFLRLGPADIAHPDFHWQMEDHQKRIWAGEAIVAESTHRCKDGRVIPVEVNARSIEYQGQPAILAVVRDITKRKQAEQALRRSEENFRNSIENSPLGVRVRSTTGGAIYANKAYLDMYGYSSLEELRSVPLAQRHTPESHAAKLERLEKGKRGEPAPPNYEVSIIRKDGEVRHLAASRKEILWDGEPRFLAMYQDITERKRAEEALRRRSQELEVTLERLQSTQQQLLQADRLASVGQLAAGLAHELNNPLTGVVGYSQLLLGRDVSKAVRRDLKRVYDEAQRASRIVHSLLAFARQHKPLRQYTDINDAIEKTMEFRAYDLKVNNIKVVMELDPHLPKTMADFHQVQQVFLNIIINAEQAMREAHGRGQLTIGTQTVEGNIRITFADDGPGIPEQNLGRIFDPFFTTREAGQGTGLGLSICYGLIKEHGGNIYAESQLGKGATIVIELPVTQPLKREGPEPTQKLPSDKSDKRVSRKNVLVVDDEPVVQALLARLLTEEGHHVDTASSGDAALGKIDEDKYDLAIIDIKMPGVDGEELYAHIGDKYPDLAKRVVFITGDTVSPETRLFLEQTGNAYLAKPFDVDQVRRMVQEVQESG